MYNGRGNDMCVLALLKRVAFNSMGNPEDSIKYVIGGELEYWIKLKTECYIGLSYDCIRQIRRIP